MAETSRRLCECCKQRPRAGRHLFCGKCLAALQPDNGIAEMCARCGVNKRIPQHRLCRKCRIEVDDAKDEGRAVPPPALSANAKHLLMLRATGRDYVG